MGAQRKTNLPAPLVAMARRLQVEPEALNDIIITTVMPGERVSNEQFIAFLAVANEYNLNPLTKEIYAFPGKGGGIQPIVSIDGWLKIINSHPQFDGMRFEDRLDEQGHLVAVTCRIFRKDRTHPIEATEYMAECNRGTEPWRKYPHRMLRHKATIQAARYAFGLAGIIDPDEAERFTEAGAIEQSAAQQDPIALIEQAQSMDELRSITPLLSRLPDGQKEQARAAWKQRKEQLLDETPQPQEASV